MKKGSELHKDDKSKYVFVIEIQCNTYIHKYLNVPRSFDVGMIVAKTFVSKRSVQVSLLVFRNRKYHFDML